MSGATRSSSHNEAPREFLVTAFSKKPGGRTEPSSDIIWSEVWDAERPLPLTHPFRWVLQKSGEKVRIRDLGTEGSELVEHPAQEIPLASLSTLDAIELAAEDSHPRCWILIQPVHELKDLERRAEAGFVPKAIEPRAVSELPAQRFFKRSSLGVALMMGVAFLVIHFIPKPDPSKEELIPPQFAKVLLSPALKQSSAARRDSSKGAGSTNIVQAFQSAAVQKTTKTLLDSKAAKALLSGSTLLNTAASSALARKVFDAKTSLNRSISGRPLDVGSKQVGLLGGKGGAGVGTGYGTGGGAKVDGQGSGLVEVDSKDVGISEGLTKNEVGKVIRDHMNEVRYCYDAALLRNPALEGKTVLWFVVRSTGHVASNARVKEPSSDAELDQCILNRLVRWKFPKPRGGVDVEISYPFLFKVLGN